MSIGLFNKNNRIVSIVFSVFFLFHSNIILGQEEITKDDYNSAFGYMYENYNNKKVFNLYVHPNWFPDSTGVWYINHALNNKKYKKITFPDLNTSDLFDHEKLATVLSDLLNEEIKANNLPLSNIEYKEKAELVITVKNEKYILNTKTHSLQTLLADKIFVEYEETSPDKKWIAYSKDYNLYIKSTETGEEKQLSTKGRKGFEYGTWYDIIEEENATNPEHFGVEWSDDSEWIYANISDLRSAEKMYLLDWNIDSLYRPKLLSYYHGSPGSRTMIYEKPAFFNIKSGKEIQADLPGSTNINGISVKKSKTPGRVYLENMTSSYQNIYIHKFDLATEKLDLLYSEISSTNIDNFTYELAEESGIIFFLSEKSGWSQLYRLNLSTKKDKPITNGTFYVNSIERIDEEYQKIYFLASGKEKGRNPYYQHLYSVSFNGENLKLLTNENRNHQISISPDGTYFVDNFSTINTPTLTALRKSDTGELLTEIAKADVSGLKNWSPPEIFTAIARDGKTTIYGAVWKPTSFDPTKKYPVIEMSYTGPHIQAFPKDYSWALGFQSYAELGFVVVVVDGLGSSGRSKQFHNYSDKNLGGNLQDHVSAIKQLGQKYSWVDTTRVGLFGHSAVGYEAGHAVSAYPDFYKVAVASSANHDYRMETAWWPEMYMGWPIDSTYNLKSSVLRIILLEKLLKRK